MQIDRITEKYGFSEDISKKPMVSVVIPAYNVEKFIDQCVESVLTQTMQDFELIVIDDGSTDKTGQKLDKYSDQRMSVIHSENGGVSRARNIGIDRASGKYLYIMDSDDYLDKDALKIYVSMLEENNADIAILDHRTFKEDDSVSENHYFSQDFCTNNKEVIDGLQRMVLYKEYSPYKTKENKGVGFPAPWTRMVKRELVEKNSIRFNPDVQGLFDDGLFALAVFQHASIVVYSRRIVYNYRILNTSLTHKYNPKRVVIHNKIFNCIDEFAESYSKDDTFYEAYAARVVLYLGTLLNVYFMNEKNTNGLKERTVELKRLIGEEHYRTASKKVNLSMLSLNQRVLAILTRYQLVYCILLIDKLKDLAKRI